MDIAILGTGTVAQTVGGALNALGHSVVLGTRDVAATLARTEPSPAGAAPITQWLDDVGGTELLTFADAAARGELVVCATSGAGALSALEAAGADHLAGKVLLDISNPLDFSHGFPPTLFVKDDDSLAEQIQRAFPATRVVKSLNTMSAHVMVAPETLPRPSSVFVSGDDADAKDEVASLLRQLGWSDVIDLGDLSTARGTEMLLPVWLRLWGALGTASFNFSIVR